MVALVDRIKQTPRFLRQLLMLSADAVCLLFAVWGAFILRLSSLWPHQLQANVMLFPASLLVGLPLFWSFDLYRSQIRYASIHLTKRLAGACGLLVLLLIFLWEMLGMPVVPRSAWILFWMLAMILVAGSRFFMRELLRRTDTKRLSSRPVVIYGAGSAGIQLASALYQSAAFLVVGFLDDDPALQGTDISGLTIYRPDALPKLIARNEVSAVLLAIPSITRDRRIEIIESLSALGVEVLVMPYLAELASGMHRIDNLREVRIEDILGRDPVWPDRQLLTQRVTGKVVLVTGAGGSIGSELCRQIALLAPQKLIMLDRDEFSLYRIDYEIRQRFGKQLAANQTEIIQVLGSVKHERRLLSVIQQHSVQTIYHAAAYKHVPIVEANPLEGVRNNIFGTLSCVRAAQAGSVETFVLISTDKAVRPTNVMGATKRIAELILQAYSQVFPQVCFCMVRFGNVLASSGSVVPLFKEQIRNGGPITVTHPEITRYFMTISEAAELVIQASSLGRGGDVFVLEMGEPVRILDMAERMIKLSGLTLRNAEHPDGDIAIIFKGLRPGEKLYEELLISETDTPTQHPMIRRAQEKSCSWDQLQTWLARLDAACRSFHEEEVYAVLEEAVDGYQHKLHK